MPKFRNAEEFIKDAKLVHGDKFDYSLVKYVDNNIKIEIICPIHGVFHITPYLHLVRYHGCPSCGKGTKGHKKGHYKQITTHKRCTKCQQLLLRNSENFGVNAQCYDGFTTVCKQCIAKTQADYRERNKERIASLAHETYLRNKKTGKIKQYRKNRRSDPINIVIDNLRTKVWCVLNRADVKSDKYFKQVDALGCSPAFLKQYLESLFTEGMSWNNYGIGGWWVDHIIPCDYFKPFTPEQQKQCFHYSNLQPLWWRDNIVKGNRLIS